MRRLSRSAFTVVIPLLFTAVACDSSDVRDERDPAVSPSEPESLVDLEAVGGIAGATWYDLSVRVDQSAIVKLYNPPVRGSIAASRFDRLGSELDGFESLDDKYLTGGCADDVWYAVTVYGTTAKTVETRDCTFILNGDNPDVVYLRALIDTLASIQTSIVQDFAPWRDLTYEFQLDASEYSLSDSILFTITVRNLATETRSLYFPYGEHVGFQILDRQTLDYIYHPSRRLEVQSTITSTRIRPHEVQSWHLLWDQSYHDSDGLLRRLSPGRYAALVWLLSSTRPSSGDPIEFEIR